MCQAKNWADCGEPASHYAPATTLRYCEYHVRYAAQIGSVGPELVPLNDKLTP